MSALTWIFVIAVSVQIVYFFAIFIRLFFSHKTELIKGEKPFVTIVVCAKNEANHLRKNILFLLNQEYATSNGHKLFEVLVIDDFSTDETALVLQEIQEKYAHLKVALTDVSFAEYKGKKGALLTAKKIAKGNILLLTDADCYPASPYWIQEMVADYKTEQIVAGYGAYAYQMGLLNAFIRWETLHTFVQYAAFAKASMPYMFVGRNVLYEKEVLSSAARNPTWQALQYGDDDLLLQDTHRWTVNISDRAAAKTISAPPQTWKEWLNQKQRHVSTGKYYRFSIQMLLGLYAISHHFTWLLGLILLFLANGWGILLLLRCLLYWSLWLFVGKKLEEKNLFLWLGITDLGWMFYHFILSPYIFIKNKITWRMQKQMD